MKQIQLFPKQTEVRDILTDQESPILELLIGGGAGGSKTFIGDLREIYMSLTYPGTRRGLGRSKMKTLRNTSLKTMTMILKNYFGFTEGKEFKITGSNDPQTPNTLKFFNGSEILLLDLKYYPSLDPDFDDLGSLELTGGFIDEAVQITSKAYQVFSSRIGRRRNEELGLKPMLLLSCNPGKNRVYQEFYKPQKNGTIEPHKKFIQILAKDNPHVQDYVKKLSLMPDGPLKQRLFYGNREYDDDANKVYSYRDLQSIFTNEGVGGEKYIVCDVAGNGKDDTIITVWDGRRIIDLIVEGKSTPETVKNLIKIKKETYNVKLKNIVYDGAGLGRGLSGLGCEIFQGASKPIPTKDATEQEKEGLNKTYLNLRAQCFFMLAKRIKSGALSIKCVDPDTQTRILEELDAIQAWKIEKDGPLQIIPKEEIRSLLGRSPDIADTISMRVYFELIEREEPNFY